MLLPLTVWEDMHLRFLSSVSERTSLHILFLGFEIDPLTFRSLRLEVFVFPRRQTSCPSGLLDSDVPTISKSVSP